MASALQRPEGSLPLYMICGEVNEQVAEQQGKYLANVLNTAAKATSRDEEIEGQPFVYKQLGMMASIGAAVLALSLPFHPTPCNAPTRLSNSVVDGSCDHANLETHERWLMLWNICISSAVNNQALNV